jgi:hypothetical protein
MGQEPPGSHVPPPGAFRSAGKSESGTHRPGAGRPHSRSQWRDGQDRKRRPQVVDIGNRSSLPCARCAPSAERRLPGCGCSSGAAGHLVLLRSRLPGLSVYRASAPLLPQARYRPSHSSTRPKAAGADRPLAAGLWRNSTRPPPQYPQAGRYPRAGRSSSAASSMWWPTTPAKCPASSALVRQCPQDSHGLNGRDRYVTVKVHKQPGVRVARSPDGLPARPITARRRRAGARRPEHQHPDRPLLGHSWYVRNSTGDQATPRTASTLSRAGVPTGTSTGFKIAEHQRVCAASVLAAAAAPRRARAAAARSTSIRAACPARG